MFKLLMIPALLLGVAPAAMAGHRHHYHGPAYYQPYGPHLACNPWGCHFAFAPRPSKIRINEHCVYKPWKDKTICKY